MFHNENEVNRDPVFALSVVGRDIGLGQSVFLLSAITSPVCVVKMT